MAAKLTPSSAHRWVRCHASATLPGQSTYDVDPRRDDADEGEAAHHVANLLALSGHAPNEALKEGSLAPNGCAITAEMLECGELFAQEVKWINDAEHGGFEHSVGLNMSFGIEGVGVIDAWGVCNDSVHVYEYKYGFSEVGAYENWQLIKYGVALVDLLKTSGVVINEVRLHVIQPRLFKMDPRDCWELTTSQLEGYGNTIKNAIAAINAGSMMASVGRHCLHCPARYGCSAIRTSTMEQIDVSQIAILEKLPLSALGSELKELERAIKLLEYRKTGIEEVVMHALKQGKPVPGWMAYQGTTAAKWDIDPSTVVLMGDAYGVDLRKPQETITPNQAVMACPALKHVMPGVTKRHNTALKLKQLTPEMIRKGLKK